MVASNFVLSSDRLTQVKRQNGESAVLRMLLAAQKQGATANDVVAIAKDVGVGATSLARLKAQVGWTPDRRKAPRTGSDRRSRARILDRSREKRAIRALLTTLGSEADVVHSVYALAEEQVDAALQLFSAYGGNKLELDTDLHALFVLRVTENEEQLWLVAVERTRERALRVGSALVPTELAGHVDEQTFAEIFPKAPAIDAIDADEVLPLLVQAGKPFDL